MECENIIINYSYKLLSNILLNRINPYIKEISGEYQVGFMLGKSTTDQIHIVKQVVEKSHEYNRHIFTIC